MSTDYTAKQLADMAGVSVRTLHYYEEVGLLHPTRDANNWRHYSAQDGSAFTGETTPTTRKHTFALRKVICKTNALWITTTQLAAMELRRFSWKLSSAYWHKHNDKGTEAKQGSSLS